MCVMKAEMCKFSWFDNDGCDAIIYGVVSLLKFGALDLESFKIRKQEFILGHEGHGNELLGKMAGPCQGVVQETLMRELSRCKMKICGA